VLTKNKKYSENPTLTSYLDMILFFSHVFRQGADKKSIGKNNESFVCIESFTGCPNKRDYFLIAHV